MEDRFIVGTKLYVAAFFQRDARCNGGAENASTGKRKYGKGKYETAHFARMENACMENASTMQTFSQIKKFGISQVSVVHFQVGWASGLQIVYLR